MIVGRVSSDKVYLATHGNFNPKFEEPMIAVRGAKLQFTLERPVGDPDFESDFDIAVTRLCEIQAQIAKTPRHKYFLEEGTTGPPGYMRLSFPLWEQMVSLTSLSFSCSTTHNTSSSICHTSCLFVEQTPANNCKWFRPL